MFIVEKKCKDGSIRHYQKIDGKLHRISIHMTNRYILDGYPVAIKKDLAV